MRTAYEPQRLGEKEFSQADSIPDSSTISFMWPIYHRAIHVHETDKDGVLHFSNYFKIAEEAMFSGLRNIGFPFENSPYSVAMLNAVTTYIDPIQFGDRIDVVLADFTMRRVKFFLVFEFQNQDGVPVARTELILATILAAERKAVPVPALLTGAFERMSVDFGATSYRVPAGSCVHKENS